MYDTPSTIAQLMDTARGGHFWKIPTDRPDKAYYYYKELDDDNDGVLDREDSCPYGMLDWTSNLISDQDGDGCNDVYEDADVDDDGVLDIEDSCTTGKFAWESTALNDWDGDGCHDAEEDEDDEDDFEHEEDYESKLFAEDQGGSLSQTAMSFDMDDNDLLFNLLYFNENPEGLDTSNIGAICETAVTETLAAHSEGNTPYKLRPASEKVQAEFDGTEKLTENMYQKLDTTECSICLEEMLIDCKIAYLKCNHCFHCDCFLRWASSCTQTYHIQPSTCSSSRLT